MAESKKVLVAFDPAKPDKQSNDFLIPMKTENGDTVLLGSRSGKVSPFGLVVLTSKPVNENDLFAKLVDAGHKVARVEDCLAGLSRFIEDIKIVRIGNIVEMNADCKLVVVANTPSGFPKSETAGQ